MRKRALTKRLQEFHDKYWDLVWYARQDKTDMQHPGRKDIERVREQYPNEVALLSGTSGDWQHGFHSGCLATAALIQGLMGSKGAAADADEDFPFLDC